MRNKLAFIREKENKSRHKLGLGGSEMDIEARRESECNHICCMKFLEVYPLPWSDAVGEKMELCTLRAIS